MLVQRGSNYVFEKETCVYKCEINLKNANVGAKMRDLMVLVAA